MKYPEGKYFAADSPWVLTLSSVKSNFRYLRRVRRLLRVISSYLAPCQSPAGCCGARWQPRLAAGRSEDPNSEPPVSGYFWLATVATTSDGRVISLLEGGRALPPDADGGHVPPGVPTLDARWRIYFVFARHSATRPLRELFPEVAERTWAGNRPETLVGKPRRVFVRP